MIQLSSSIASVFFFRCVRECTNERQAGNSGALMRYLLNYELNTRSVYDNEKQLCCNVDVNDDDNCLQDGRKSYPRQNIIRSETKFDNRTQPTLHVFNRSSE